MLVSAKTGVFFSQSFSTDKLFKSISNTIQSVISIVNVFGEKFKGGRSRSPPPPPRHTTCKKAQPE